jgi:hypothetical protein
VTSSSCCASAWAPPSGRRSAWSAAISTESFVDGLDPTYFNVGEEVFMVGRYVNHEAASATTPPRASVHIAQLPYEPIPHFRSWVDGTHGVG